MIIDVASIGFIADEDILLHLASLALSHLDHENRISPHIEKLEELEDHHSYSLAVAPPR